MKQTIKKTTIRGLLLGLSLSLLFSCKKEKAEVTLHSSPDGSINVANAPISATSPKTADFVEKPPFLPSARKALTGGSNSVAGVTDYVDFDDPFSLSLIPDQAKYMFAISPFYIQQVGNAWVHVKENSSGSYLPFFISNYGHYHLSFQNFEPCLKENGEFGKTIGGGCANINPLQEPRTLGTHVSNQWIKIYAYDYNNPQRVFDLQGIKVIKSTIQLWYKKHNGGWYKWPNLGEGTWNLSAYSTGITEVLIAGNGNGPIGFDNVKIKMPYN